MPADGAKRGRVSTRRAAADGRDLVIVESRAKATTIQKILGDGYEVVASIGHVRDLPKDSLGVNKANNFEPLYVIPREKRAVLAEISSAAQRAGQVLIATDPDREGEAIAWHLLYAAELDVKKVQRVTFHEVTGPAVKAALAVPGEIDMKLVEAQQARRILDRLVGFEISPILARRIRGATSAGRVQSVALRFVVDREREILAFVPEEWWSIEAKFSTLAADERVFVAVLEPVEGALKIRAEEEAKAIIDRFAGAAYSVADVREQTSSPRPQAPFTTATLQRAASSELGISPSTAMRIAQRLYEGLNVGDAGQVGLITYMRTDSTQVARTAQDEAREYIAGEFGKDYIPSKPPFYKSKSRIAQEAHEAIRPTSAFRTPEKLMGFLDGPQMRLYELIWRRFVASQMAAARVRSVTVFISARSGEEPLPYRFRSTTSQVLFPGHYAVSRAKEKPDVVEETERALLLSLKTGDAVVMRDLAGRQHFTEPPPRFTEASLIRALEEEDIGRPSTYAPTTKTLIDRAYVELERRALKPTELGVLVTDALVEHFPEIVDKAFTRRMEVDLDEVATGARGRVELLRDFYDGFSQTLELAKKNMQVVKLPVELLGQACPQCGRELVIRRGPSGKFVGCSGFPECKYTRPLGIGVTCPKCGEGEVVSRRPKRGRVFYGCGRYPACDYTSWRRPTDQKCSVCGGTMYVAARGTVACGDCGNQQGPAPSS